MGMTSRVFALQGCRNPSMPDGGARAFLSALLLQAWPPREGAERGLRPAIGPRPCTNFDPPPWPPSC